VKTFVVRLHEDAGSDPAGAEIQRLCGVVNEVATGLRATFRSEGELIAALKAAAMGTDLPGATGPSRDGGDRAPGGSAPDERGGLPHLPGDGADGRGARLPVAAGAEEGTAPAESAATAASPFPGGELSHLLLRSRLRRA